MMLMMPLMLVFWVALVVGVVLLARWLSRGGEPPPAAGQLPGWRGEASVSADRTDEAALLSDAAIERGVVAAHRRIGELEAQVSWQGRLLAAEADRALVARSGQGDAVAAEVREHADPGGIRSDRSRRLAAPRDDDLAARTPARRLRRVQDQGAALPGEVVGKARPPAGAATRRRA